MGVCSDIQNMRDQNVWLTRETTKGTLAYPVVGTSKYLVASSPVTFSDEASYTNSEELRNSLNLRDQTKDKQKAGSLSFSAYMRPVALGSEPQEGILLEAALGNLLVQSYTPSAGYSDVAASIVISDVVGQVVPPRGVLLNSTSSEQILYTSYDPATRTFSGLTRGYNGTTAAAGLVTDTLVLHSKVYSQAVCANSYSLAINKGETWFWFKGCTINSASFTGAVNGYINLSYEGAYMQKFMAGVATYVSHTGGTASPAVVTLGLTSNGVKQANLFSVGARIWNKTQKDSNTNVGYTITAVDTTANTITLESTTLTGWTAADRLEGFMPVGTVTGETQTAKYTEVYFDGVKQAPKGFDISVGTPKIYIEDEITTDAISDFVSDMRDINGTVTSYFRGYELVKFVEADADVKKKIEARLGDGDTGSTVWLVLPKCTVQTPTITDNGSFADVAQVFTALDTEQEDSCYFIYV